MAVNDKKITGLATATRFSAGDLMVVRKSDVGDDRKISYANVMRSIGNTAVKGFTAVQGEDMNKIILTPSTGVALDTYYDGMTISFVAPVTTTDVVQIKIAGLEYADFKNYSKVSTVALAQGEYVEAIFDDNDSKFYKTNNESQPNSSTEYSVGGTVNIIELSSMNALVKERYYDGMVINFLTKGDSTANVTVKVDGLAALPLKNQFSQQVNNLINDQLVTASYKALPNPHFVSYIVKDSYVTNDYIVSSTEITPDESSTTLNLTSADGAAKTRYYNAMSLIFTSPIETKGAIYLKVDGLGAKELKDPDGDLLPDDLDANELILAVYNGTHFVKHMFSTIEPPAPPLPVDPNVPIPEKNKRSVYVGPNRAITSVKTAIDELIREYGENGGNHICTIFLESNYVFETLAMPTNANLSWITINCPNRLTINNKEFIRIYEYPGQSWTGTHPTISGSFRFASTVQGQQSGGVFIVAAMKTRFENFILEAVYPGTLLTFSQQKGGEIQIINSSFSDVSYVAAESTRYVINGCTFNNTMLRQIASEGSSVKSCNFVYNVMIYATANSLLSFGGAQNLVVEDCNVTSYLGGKQLINVQGGQVTLKNVTTTQLPVGNSTTGVFAERGAKVLIDGGDYRHQGGQYSGANIVASGAGTVITLKNNVRGGYTELSGGRVITE